MSVLARQGLSPDEFYAWVVGQEAKFELVDGAPVMMAAANRRHDRIVANAIRVLGNQLEGRPCQPFTSDTYIRIPAGNRRLPDLSVDCGRFDDASLEAMEPRLVVEVLSPTTRTFDRNDKLEGYKEVETLEYILLVDPDLPQLRLYSRDVSRTWLTNRWSGLEFVIEMPQLELQLKLRDLYAGLVFQPRPVLVGVESVMGKLSI